MIYFLIAVEVQSVKLRSMTHSRTWPEPKGKSGNRLFFKKRSGAGGQGGGREKKKTQILKKCYLRPTYFFILKQSKHKVSGA